MPIYDDATKKMPSLAEMLMAARARRQANPGQRPPDATGPALVTMQGQAPIQAQMVDPGRDKQAVQVRQPGPTIQQIRQMLAEGKIDPRMAQLMFERAGQQQADAGMGGNLKAQGM